MEIKIILVGMLIGCSYLVGEDISKRYIKRHKQLNDLIRVLEIMRMDLAFGMYTLEEIFRNIAVKDEYDFSEFFLKFADELSKEDGKTIEQILQDTINILYKNTYLKENEIELVILAGYLKIVSPKLINEYRNRIINIHPSLIPAFCGKGYYGEKVHQGVIDYGVKVTGATVHFVDEGADTGPIIMQKTVKVKQDDDAKKLAARVLEVEHEILTKSISMFCEKKLNVQGRRVYIND